MKGPMKGNQRVIALPVNGMADRRRTKRQAGIPIAIGVRDTMGITSRMIALGRYRIFISRLLPVQI
jgi:hypothetical protein